MLPQISNLNIKGVSLEASEDIIRKVIRSDNVELSCTA